MPDPGEVETMFTRIAGRYDLGNRLLSGGIDQLWRRRTVRAAERALGSLKGRDVLDVCCGTGDLTLAFARRGARSVGADFTQAMLVRALPKGPEARAGYARADALCLPVRDGAVDVVSVAFGLRNVADRRRGLAEMARVLRPGGVALVLEFTLPQLRPLRALYGWYFTRVLPVLGGWISGDRGAYTYLPDSVYRWPGPRELREEMVEAGLEHCEYQLLSGGIAALHSGRKPGGLSREDGHKPGALGQ